MLMRVPTKTIKNKFSGDPKDLKNYQLIINNVTLDSKAKNLKHLLSFLTPEEIWFLGNRQGCLISNLHELMVAIKEKGIMHENLQQEGSDIEVNLLAGSLDNNSSYAKKLLIEESYTKQLLVDVRSGTPETCKKLAYFNGREGKVNKNDVMGNSLDDPNRLIYLRLEIPREHHHLLQFQSGDALAFEVYKIPGFEVGAKLTREEIDKLFDDRPRKRKVKVEGKPVINMKNAYEFGWIKQFDIGEDY